MKKSLSKKTAFVSFSTVTSAYLLFGKIARADVKIEDKFGFGSINTLGEGISKFVVPTFSLAAVLVILYFVFAGFKYLTSGGNKEEIASAQKMIQYAIIGFVVLMAAFVILQFLLVRLFGITGLRIIGF